MSSFVLTQSQFILALVSGAQLQSFIPDSVATAMKEAPEKVSFIEVDNGVIIGFDEASASVDAAEAATAGDVHEVRASGPDPEKVKTELAKVMDRPPGLTTVRTWDAGQRRKALKWCKDPADETRPEFIVERKARGSKNDEARESTTETTDVKPAKVRKPRASKADALPNGATDEKFFDDAPPSN